MTKLTRYERCQLDDIAAWKVERPSVISRYLATAISPAAWLVTKIIPDAAIRGVLDFSSSAAEWLTDTNDILRKAGVSQLAELQTLDLEQSDTLANEVHNWAIGLASAEGAAAGATGLPGLVLDIPAVIVQALRLIHKIGVCYGFASETAEDRNFVLGILAASGANTMEEKVAALAALQAIEVSIARETAKALGHKAVSRSTMKDSGIIGIKNLSKQLGVNLAKRKTLQAIPAMGALVGASVNGWYLNEVGWAARRAFQERWLLANHKISAKTAAIPEK